MLRGENLYQALPCIPSIAPDVCLLHADPDSIPSDAESGPGDAEEAATEQMPADAVSDVMLLETEQGRGTDVQQHLRHTHPHESESGETAIYLPNSTLTESHLTLAYLQLLVLLLGICSHSCSVAPRIWFVSYQRITSARQLQAHHFQTPAEIFKIYCCRSRCLPLIIAGIGVHKCRCRGGLRQSAA